MSSNGRIGVMTGVNPYQVQLDGESAPLNIAPVVLATVNVGDYVWCEFFGSQLVVTGRIQDSSVPQLGSTEDLNSFVNTGVWNQPLTANASSAHHYPVTAAGLLEVTRAEANGNMIHQRYATYSAIGVWVRTYYNGTWNAWTLSFRGPVDYTPLGASNFNPSGTIRVEYMSDGRRRAVYNMRLTRAVSNFGTISTTSWTTIGTVVPSAAQFAAQMDPNYLIGLATTGSTEEPIAIALTQGSGVFQFKGISGLTTTINIGDGIQLNAVILEG